MSSTETETGAISLVPPRLPPVKIKLLEVQAPAPAFSLSDMLAGPERMKEQRKLAALWGVPEDSGPR